MPFNGDTSQKNLKDGKNNGMKAGYILLVTGRRQIILLINYRQDPNTSSQNVYTAIVTWT